MNIIEFIFTLMGASISAFKKLVIFMSTKTFFYLSTQNSVVFIAVCVFVLII